MSVCFSCKKGKKNPGACNGSSTRRELKLASDDAASLIDTVPVITTVVGLGSLSVPDIDGDSDRQDVEKKVYTITATVHKIGKHRDGDWKVKLTDGNDHFVNCESPNPSCEFASESIFYEELWTVRRWIEARLDELEGKTVTITGIGFIDIDHKYPRNAAENEMELHPILDIHY